MKIESVNARSSVRLMVIIPVFGNWEDTLECLAMLARQSNSNFEVLIADDGSPSPAPPELHEFAFVECRRYPHRGFAGNCNAAARDAIGRGATHLLLLNSDTAVSEGFIEGWLRTVERLPAAIVSPLIYRFEQPSKVWYSGGGLSIWAPFFKLRNEYREITRVDLVSGCALLIPAGHWRTLAGFREDYVTYFEDLDFSLRARAAGIAVYVVPDAGIQVRHKESGSFRNVARWERQYLQLQARLIFIRSHYQGLRRYFCFGLGCAHLVVTALHFLPDLPRPRPLWRAIAGGFGAVRSVRA